MTSGCAFSACSVMVRVQVADQMNEAGGADRQAHEWEVPGAWFLFLRVYLAWTAAAHLFWQIVQLPPHTICAKESLAQNVFAVLHCTGET